MNFPTLPENDNIGGAIYFYYIPVRSILSIPRPVRGFVGTLISLQESSDWFTGYSTYDTLSFDSRAESDANGGFYDNVLKGFYPKPSSTFLNHLDSMRNDRFIVLVRDSNGRTRIMGTMKQPCRFSFTEKTGTRASDIPGVTYEFRCETLKQCYFYGIAIMIPDIEPEV